jgi:outer membrane biosynthesis protein TonB
MAFLIVSIVIISAVAAFLLLKKQHQAPVEQPVEQPAAPVVPEAEKIVEAIKKPEPKKKMAAKPIEKKPIVVEKVPAKKPAKKGK